ncbi:hypothetical protein [uncultured Roseobacter sp.]|uniref:hypothetical protein n=1 Tax=uncultured Roseobacter sp. TaxID=114847 RepID=UPI0026263C5E|nr:hypothetical protein [uncultured Roseobacter sp.]
MYWGRLWPKQYRVDDVEHAWDALKSQWKADDADWSFWIEWYEAILNGTPLPWDLTQRIALELTDEQWEAGQETVARRISEIRAAFEVQTLANEVAEAAYLAQPGKPGMGHNRPPSVIDEDLPSQAHETIIWAATDELRTQAQAKTPAPSRIKRALSLIAGVLKASGLWVAGTVATGISVAAVTVVKKGADAWAVHNQDKLVELIDAALRWLSLLH